MPALSPRRAGVLSFIRDRVAGHGQSPSHWSRLLRPARSPRGDRQKACAGLGRGRPDRVDRRTGAPSARPGAELLRVSVLVRVAAGPPIGVGAALADILILDARLFLATPDYLLRVQGDSMIEDGVLDGDLVGVCACCRGIPPMRCADPGGGRVRLRDRGRVLRPGPARMTGRRDRARRAAAGAFKASGGRGRRAPPNARQLHDVTATAQ